MVRAEWGGEDEEAGVRQAKAQVLTARKVESKQAVLWMQIQRKAQVAAGGHHEQNGGGVGAHEAGLGPGAARWGDSASQQGHGRRMGPRHGNAPDAKGNGHDWR